MQIPSSLKQKMYLVAAVGLIAPAQAQSVPDSSENNDYGKGSIPRTTEPYARSTRKFDELKQRLERRKAANGPTAKSADSAWSAQFSSSPASAKQASPVTAVAKSAPAKSLNKGISSKSVSGSAKSGAPLAELKNALEQSDQRIPKVKDPCYGCGRG